MPHLQDLLLLIYMILQLTHGLQEPQVVLQGIMHLLFCITGKCIHGEDLQQLLLTL